MEWLKSKAVLGTALASLCLIATEVFARSLFGDPYGRSNQSISDYMLYLTLMRIGMMVLSIGFGYVLGWFISPQASELRRMLMLGIAALTILIGVFNNGALGWGAASLVSIIGFLVALGYWIGSAVKAMGEVPSTFGSSRWAKPDDLRKKKLFDLDGIRLGMAFNGEIDAPISYKGDSHLLTVAPTRTGKGTTQIINNLLTYEGSVLVIDPKGENAMITAKARQDMGQKVMLVDPWGIAQIDGIETARFNPMDWLLDNLTDLAENCMILAEAIVIPAIGGSEPFWKDEAKAFIIGVLGYVATDPDEDGQRHMGRLRDLFLLDGDDLKELLKKMMQSPHQFIASAGARGLQKDEKLLSNVIASVQAETHFLDSPCIRESVSESDFKFEDLKTEKLSIYLVIPADRIHAFNRWTRLLIQIAITVNARNIADKPEQPVLFILDELPALGKMPVIEQSYGLMAGFGMQLWGFVQDLSQLEGLYGKGWQSFIANSGMINYFGSRDRMTSEYFSALCGETTVWNFSSALSRAFGRSSSSNGITSSSTTTTHTDTRAASQRKLAYPDELMRMHETKQLVFIDNMYPLIATKTPWFEDEDLKTKGVDLHEK